MSQTAHPESRLNQNRVLAQKAANAIAICMAAHGLGGTVKADPGDTLDAGQGKVLQLPDMVVNDEKVATGLTSAKFTQPIIDTPQTVTVIPPEVYQAQAATTLSDVLRDTPGITFFAGEGGSANRTGGDSFYLRGFDTSNSIFIDGVREEGAVVHDVFNVGQVEVFKSPAADNGRGGTAGYINLETKVPDTKPFEELAYVHGFSAEGSRNSDRFTLDVNSPVAASPVPGTAVRLNLLSQQGGVPGRQYVENNRWGVAPSLAFGLGTSTRAFVTYEHLYENNLPDYGVPSTVLTGLSPASLHLDSPNVDLSNYYGFVNDNYEHVTSDTATARIEREFAPQIRLTDQVRYDGNTRFVEASSPSGAATIPVGQSSISQGIYSTKNWILSEQANLRASFKTAALAHDTSTGIELSRETSDNPTWATTPAGAPVPSYLVSIYQPLNFPQALPNYSPHATGSTTNTRINTGAWYGFDTIKLGKSWELSGGVRLEHYNVHELSLTAALPATASLAAQAATATTPATAAYTGVVAVPASSAVLTAAKTTASWKGGLVFKPQPNGSIYFSYDTSTRPPGTSGATNTLSTTTTSADNPLLQPEEAINYELGTKWEFLESRLLTSVALFRSVNTNVPATDPTTGLVDQTSDQTVDGIELSVSGKITQAWLVFAGYSHLKPTVSYAISTNAQGLTLPLLPEDSGNLWTTYALPHGVSLGGGLQYMGKTGRLQSTQAPTATTFGNSVPSYWLFNAMISYAYDKHLSFRLNVNNVTSKTFIASLNNNGNRLNLGAPRAFLLSADLRF